MAQALAQISVLYGKTLRLEFFRRLRDEIRFDSLDALKTQIASDAETTRRYFQDHSGGFPL